MASLSPIKRPTEPSTDAGTGTRGATAQLDVSHPTPTSCSAVTDEARASLVYGASPHEHP
jgi:hypothetical protein